jgi:hypothetical protein
VCSGGDNLRCIAAWIAPRVYRVLRDREGQRSQGITVPPQQEVDTAVSMAPVEVGNATGDLEIGDPNRQRHLGKCDGIGWLSPVCR